jgi:hypothetical protein
MTRKRFQRLRIGDWVMTQRGHLFVILSIDRRDYAWGPNDYGPMYRGDSTECAAASAIAAARRDNVRS